MPADHPVTFHATDRPQMTITVPAGWKARKRDKDLLLTRDGRRVRVRPCPLERSERDMTGRRAMRRLGGNVAVRGGGCLFVRPKLALRAELGNGRRPRASDPAAEQLARAARQKTLGEARATGTATATVGRRTIPATWEWDLTTSYFHQSMQFGDLAEEVVRRPDGDYLRGPYQGNCWGGTSTARGDDALEPRLELSEWNVPPATRTAWHVAYAAPEPRADGTTRVRWTGFVADGEAIVGADGRLDSVSIDDHGQAVGRTSWRGLTVTFTDFPAALVPVQPEPAC